MSEQPEYLGPEYPTQAHGSIPAFTSYEEEANFWDTHDFTEFKNETRLVKVRSTRDLSENVQVRFDTETDRELGVLAQERGLKKATILSSYVGSMPDLPDEFEEELMRRRHEVPPTPPMDEQLLKLLGDESE